MISKWIIVQVIKITSKLFNILPMRIFTPKNILLISDSFFNITVTAQNLRITHYTNNGAEYTDSLWFTTVRCSALLLVHFPQKLQMSCGGIAATPV